MKRFRGLLAAVLIATAAAAATAAAGTSLPAVQATEAGARFPFRSYVLTLPKGAAIGSASVRVTENGVAVRNITVTPASAAKNGKFGVVLALDASNSMAGEPIAAAVAAARAFASHRAATQQLGIVTFNSTVRTHLPLTTDPQRIGAVLTRTPKLANGTHIYDAVLRAVRMLGRAGVSSGSVVLLSDGADTVSRVSLDEVATAAQKAHVRIFTVGFRSKVFDPAALTRLAAQTEGSFSEADSPAQLERVYSLLGAQFSREYLLQYQSLAGPGRDIAVKIAIGGVAQPAVVGYRTPPLQQFTAPAIHTSLSYRLWRSTLAMVAIALICALLLAFAVWALLRPAPSGLQGRVAEFVSLYTPDADPSRSGGLAESVRVGNERSFVERSSAWRRFVEGLEIAEVGMSPAQIVLGTAVATGVAVFMLAGITGSRLFSVFGFLVPLLVYNALKGKLAKKRRLFSDQIPDALQVIASAMRAGHTVIGALAVVSSESPEPMRSEMRRAVADEQLGVPLDTALDRVSRRMESREFEQVAVVAGLQREAGGNVAEVLDRVADSVRERIELRQLVRSLTAQGRLSRWILTLLPPGLAGIIALLDPGYLAPLVDKSLGRAILVLAGLMIVVGSLLIKRIVDVKV
jgi:tight adherence protein B